MIKQFSFLFIGIFLSSLNSFAQIDPDAIGYYTDALRFSQSVPRGTARFQGMGGVNNALGADLSSLSGNPAGMGFYQKSEIGITAALGFGNSNSTFLDNSRKDSRSYFYFPNFGMAFASKKDETQGGVYRGGAFGIGLTRINNFQNQFSYSGVNNTNSIADYFVDISNGIPNSQLYDEFDNITTLSGLAYWTWVINDDLNDPNGKSYINYRGTEPSKQEETVLTRGAINQWNFSYGGNFSDKFYIGASVGVPILRYLTNKTFKETVTGSPDVNYFKFSESLKVRGTGINLKIGTIFKPEDWIRIGLTIQTPTIYSIHEDFGYSLRSEYLGALSDKSSNEKTVPGEFKYNLTTPFKASAGIALFKGKSGFIAADIEFVPYSSARLNENSVYSTSDNSTFFGDNVTIQNLYKPALNINVGGEYRYQIYRFRGGYSLMGDAYTNYDGINRKVMSISGGAGVRLEEYYFDIALVNSRYNSVYRSYKFTNGGGSPEAQTKNGNTSFVMSAGMFF